MGKTLLDYTVRAMIRKRCDEILHKCYMKCVKYYPSATYEDCVIECLRDNGWYSLNCSQAWGD